MSYRTDRQRVHGLGTAHDGAHHWWSQRLTSAALVLLTPLFLFPFVRALGSSWEHVITLYSSPWHAIVAILFLLVAFVHLHQGLQVVIEDYVHGSALRTLLLLASLFLCLALALTGVFAVAKIAFTA